MGMIYRFLSTIFPKRALSTTPKRIVFIRPCCIGDVMVATAALKALRRHYPDAHITWAVGGWSKQAIINHDLIDDVLDTGPAANPAKANIWKFARQLRDGKFDLAVSLVRSPFMSVAMLLSGIPNRVGIDSNGRGFGYTMRVPIDPMVARHEAQIYLDVVAAVGADTSDCYVNVPVHEADVTSLRAKMDIETPYAVINPAGGSNPGMMMDAKRWPPQNYAALADRLTEANGLRIVIIGGPDDGELVNAVISHMKGEAETVIGTLPFGEIAALFKHARVYVGNDTGLTHMAAATGTKTVMVMGPSDPGRYRPFAPNAIAAWKPYKLKAGGVASGVPSDWDWERKGIGVQGVIERVEAIID